MSLSVKNSFFIMGTVASTAISTVGDVANHVQDNITKGVINNANNGQDKWRTTWNTDYDKWKTTTGRDFQSNYLNYQNRANIAYTNDMLKVYSKNGIPPAIALGTPANGLSRYQVGISRSRPTQDGFNGNNQLGFSKPRGF